MSMRRAANPWRNVYAHPCSWDAHYDPLSLPGLLEQAVARWPDRPLVEFLGRSYSYAALHAQARRFAAGLQEIGIGRGDRVGLFLPNVPAYLAAYYGALIAGATVVNFSPLYSPQELEAQVVDSGTRLLVTVDVPALLPTAIKVLRESPLQTLVVTRLADQLPRVKGLLVRLFGLGQVSRVPREAGIVQWRDMVRGTGDPDPVAIDPEHDLALLQYTGGTTGTPKGAMLTHQNLTANARQIVDLDPHRSERDMILGALPLFHVFANTCVLNRTVADGGCLAMVPRFDIGQVLAAVRRTRPTSFPGVPTMFQALLHDDRLEGTDMSSLNLCISGGAPLQGPVREQFESVTGVYVCEGYGLTECSGVASTNPFNGPGRPGTIGHPFPATRLALLDKDDATAFAAPGDSGELIIAGPQIMQGYWKRPDADAAAFVELPDEEGTVRRWLRTGDIALLEPDGYVKIVDRSKDMIAVGGFKVFPSQVEHVLIDHAAVAEAAVLGLPDAYHGELPRAFVTLKPGMTADADELRDWLNARVGKHERVDRVVIRQTLPKTMIGKLDRKVLKAEALAEG